MKIIILIENDLSCDPNLVNEFGFSVFIQDEDTSLIFDTGQSGIFIKNIEKLKQVEKILQNKSIKELEEHSFKVKRIVEEIIKNKQGEI